jgi:hypothetical protein
VLSVQRSRGLSEVPKMEKSSIVKEETGGRRSRGSGEGTSKVCREANKDLREVMKSDFKSRTIGSGRKHMWQRINTSLIHDQKKQSREETGLAKSELTIRSQPLIARKNEDRRSGPNHSSIQKSGKEEEVTHESPEVQGRERIWPMVIVYGHINGRA